MTSGGRARLQQVLVCAGELLFQSAPLLSSPRFPICIPTLSISPLKMLPFLFSSLLSQFCLSHPFLSHLFLLFPSFSVVPFLCSHSLLFILSSPPLSSLYCSPSFPPHLFRSSRSPRTRERGTSESSLTRNTPTPDSSIFCDGSGGSGSPCAPARRWVRSQTGIP